jgi:hypothetical protein
VRVPPGQESKANGELEAGDEAVGITLGGSENARVVKGQVLAVLFPKFRRLDKGAFSCLPGSVQQNGGCIGERVLEPPYKMTVKRAGIMSYI